MMSHLDLPHSEHRKLAASLFNEVWDLLEIESRTEDQDAKMIHRAHASRYHWGIAGTSLNMARALVVIDSAAACGHLVAARKAGADIKHPKDQSWLETNLEAIDSALRDT